MEDYSIIQGQSVLEVMFALLLTLVTSYVYISCRVYAQRTDAAHLARLKALRQFSTDANQQSSSPKRALSEKSGFSLGDWLAPIIVWSAVIWITLAVVSILLGDG
jgi:hypothetical protein